METINRFKLFFRLCGSLNYYEGVDKLNFWQWLYAWRLSIKTSWKVARIIHPSKRML